MKKKLWRCSKRLKELSAQRELSQEKMAVKAGLSRRTVQNAEAGKDVTYDTCCRLAKALACTVEQFASPVQLVDPLAKHPAVLHRVELAICHNNGFVVGDKCVNKEDIHKFVEICKKVDQDEFRRVNKDRSLAKYNQGHRLLNKESFQVTLEQYTRVWKANQESLRMIRLGKEIVGITAVIPLTARAYSEVRSGRRDFSGLTQRDIVSTGNRLLLESAVATPDTSFSLKRVAEMIRSTLLIQIARLAADLHSRDIRIVSFDYITTLVKRLVANGFVKTDAKMAKYGFEIYEFDPETDDPEAKNRVDYVLLSLRHIRHLLDVSQNA